MKILRLAIIATAISALLFSCTQQKQETDPAKAKKEVAEVLNQTKQHFVDKNADGLLGQYAKVDHFVDYGEDKDEAITDFAEFEKMYKDAFGRDFEYEKLEMKDMRIHVNGDVAWFGTDVHSVVKMDTCDVKFGGRLTGVLENIDGEWKYVMTHYNEFDDDCCESGDKEGCCEEKHKDSECCDDDKKSECCDEETKKECDDKDKDK
jgi:hypothetical protein